MQDTHLKAPLIGICRHRIATDGEGVTTLVAFHSCTLHCKYCLNARCLSADGVSRVISTKELIDEVEIDNLYFLATGGGITFGGGEPLLRSDFIAQCGEMANPQWNISIETCLNVDRRHLEEVFPYINKYIIDIKDMNPTIYKAYTSQDNKRMKDNLRWLIDKGANENVKIRLPLIPDYNTQKDVDQSEKELREMGFQTFDRFEYKKDVSSL